MISKTAKRWLIGLATLVAVIEIVMLLLIWVAGNFEDKVITEGSAYGFSIGDSREACFANAAGLFDGATVLAPDPLDPQEATPPRNMAFTGADLSLLMNWSTWKFYVTNQPFDALSLTFTNDHLVEIRTSRHFAP